VYPITIHTAKMINPKIVLDKYHAKTQLYEQHEEKSAPMTSKIEMSKRIPKNTTPHLIGSIPQSSVLLPI